MNLEHLTAIQNLLLDVSEDNLEETTSILQQSTLDHDSLAFEIHRASLLRENKARLYASIVNDMHRSVRRSIFFVVPPNQMSVPFLEACIDLKLINEVDILGEFEQSYLSPDLTEEIAIANMKLIGRTIRDFAPPIFTTYMDLIKDKESIFKLLRDEDEDDDFTEIFEEDNSKELATSLYKGRSCLDLAIKFRADKCYDFLIENGEIPTNSTYLAAIKYGKLDVLPKTLSSIDGALECAIRYFRNSVVKTLIDSNVEISESSVMAAVEVGNTEILKLLNIHLTPKIAQHAAKNGSLASLLYFDMPDGIVNIACEYGHLHIVKNVKILPSDCLIYAVKSFKLSLVRYCLLQSSVDVNATDEDGNTALHYASIGGSMDIVKDILLDENVNVNSANKEGQTPLHFAAKVGNADVIKLLLEQDGIKRLVRDKSRNTPLMLAKANKKQEAVDLLKESANETGGNTLLTEFFKYK